MPSPPFAAGSSRSSASVSAGVANVFKSKKDAQDAHEAIRPANPELHPDEIRRYLSDEQYKLYKLIWQRFVASQMMPAVYDQTTVDIVAKADRGYDFRVTGSVLKFDGFLKVYEEVEREEGRRRRVAREQASGAECRRHADAQGIEAGTAFHGAASALQRSFAGEGA